VRVPFLSLIPAFRELRSEVHEAVARVMESGLYLLGPELAAFEREFAEFIGSRHCIGVGSGLDAIGLALRATGVGPGHEVIVPSHTFIATWLAVSHLGATPVPVEPDDRTFNIDPTRIEAAIGPKTRAIVPVHLYGQPADMESIGDIARKHGLVVVEDAAQAHGAAIGPRRVGGLGHVAAWSFYPSKNLGALADGGAVTTDDDTVAEACRVFRNYGSETKYVHPVRGLNSRLDELNAAILRIKLRRLEQWNARRARVAARYGAGLAGCGDLVLPHVPGWARPVWHLYVVRTQRRDALRRHLQADEIETLIHYPVAPHAQGAYADLRLPEGACRIAESIQGQVLSLPIGPHLPDEGVEACISSVLAFHA